MLNEVNVWCEKWLLYINDCKSKIIHFRKKNKTRANIKVLIGSKTIDYVSSYKYLGIYFSEFLTFDHNREMLSTAGNRALGSLLSKYKSNKQMPFSVYSKLFFSCVAPVLDYGSEVWGMYKLKEIEKVQQSAALGGIVVN